MLTDILTIFVAIILTVIIFLIYDGFWFAFCLSPGTCTSSFNMLVRVLTVVSCLSIMYFSYNQYDLLFYIGFNSLVLFGVVFIVSIFS